MQRKPSKTLFELPRPRGRSRCSPEAAKAGYWHRRATAIERKLAAVSREAAEAKEAAAKATTKIAAMEHFSVCSTRALQQGDCCWRYSRSLGGLFFFQTCSVLCSLFSFWWRCMSRIFCGGTVIDHLS